MEKALTVPTAVGAPDVVLNLDDIKKYICQGATDKEFFMFVNIAKSYGLNPLKRELFFIKYGSQAASIIVGYESYIKRAERTGMLDGWGVALGKDDLGQKATITIYRKDRSKPFEWTVYRSEFDTQQANWKKMPLFMLRKVAISQGFRLAFPEEIGGMPYIPEELPAAGTSEELPSSDPVANGEVPTVMDAVAAISACETMDCLKEVWEQFKQFRNYRDFQLAKDAKKAQLTMVVDAEVVEDSDHMQEG
jgi:phage recombination protein Bet